MALADVVRDVGSRELTLTVVNRTDPDPVQEMLEDLFDGQPVRVEERDSEGAVENLLVLRDEEESVAISSLDSVRDSILLVNSDLYITGARDLDGVETPDVIAELDGLPFSVKGYPEAESKFLLIEISRHIEALALEVGEGILHAGFQEISRVEDERGTRRVYEQLVDAGVETHVYGIPDRTLEEFRGRVHAEPAAELRRTWFLVFVPPGDESHAALVCIETGRNEWDGLWTYEATTVEDVHRHLVDTYH